MFVLIILTDHTISKLDYTIRHIFDCIIMSNHDDRISIFLINGFDQFQNLLGCIVIKRTRRFITEQDIRILYDSTTNCCSLLLASGQTDSEVFSDVQKVPVYAEVHPHPVDGHLNMPRPRYFHAQ